MKNAHTITRDFEEALREYTGAPYVNVVNSCTMALRLALDRLHYLKGPQKLVLPRRTYVSVPAQVIQAGHAIEWSDYWWEKWYAIVGSQIVDSAHWFSRDMYHGVGKGSVWCLSFHSQKPLGIEQGGAILHDDEDAWHWYNRARFDGRTPGVPVAQDDWSMPARYRHHCYINPSTAALGLQRLYALMHHDTNYPDCSEVV